MKEGITHIIEESQIVYVINLRNGRMWNTISPIDPSDPSNWFDEEIMKEYKEEDVLEVSADTLYRNDDRSYSGLVNCSEGHGLFLDLIEEYSSLCGQTMSLLGACVHNAAVFFHGYIHDSESITHPKELIIMTNLVPFDRAVTIQPSAEKTWKERCNVLMSAFNSREENPKFIALCR